MTFRPAQPVVIGLLGGIASGKSTVARMFAEEGLLHIDADRHARTLTEQPEVVQQIAARFGPAVLRGNGELARDQLARIVFADPAARRDLEALIHPRVRARILAELGAARAAGRSVLLDVPLLLENGLIEQCDACVFVDADQEVREARALSRGWDLAELARREANQAPLALKKQRCAYIIHNQGPLHESVRQVQSILAQLGNEPPSRA